MSVRIIAVIAAVSVALLAGCGGSPNTDPRKGRVITGNSDCLFGGCYYDWKVCVGPDLVVSLDGEHHEVKASPECEVTP